MTQKKYYRHSGYPGGLKEVTLRDQLQKFPNRVIEAAVRGMLPKNRLGRRMFKKLKVYPGSAHPHEAQQPKVLDVSP
jgi:large subunit ribosomal protein L13